MRGKAWKWSLLWDITDRVRAKMGAWLVCFTATPSWRTKPPVSGHNARCVGGDSGQRSAGHPSPVPPAWKRGLLRGRGWEPQRRHSAGSPVFHFASVDSRMLSGLSGVLNAVVLTFSLCAVGENLRSGAATVENRMESPPNPKI